MTPPLGGLVRSASHMRLAAVVVTLFVVATSSLSVLVQAVEGDSTPAGAESRIRVVIPSLVEVEEKLKWLIELSPDPKLRKQWRKLKEDLIDAFTDGVDEKKPVAMDIVMTPDGLCYELRIPISNLTDAKTGFLAGLRGRGYVVNKRGEGTYEILVKDLKPTHMLIDKNYAWIATGNRPNPTKPPTATLDLQPLLALKKDIIAEVKNPGETVSARRANYQAFRSHAEVPPRKRRSETQTAFDLRKVLLKLLLSEAERFLVEAEDLQVSWTFNTSKANSSGRGELSLSALPETDLLKMIEEVGKRPGFFANVLPHDNRLAAANLSAPLDAIRGNQLKEFLKSLRPILDSEIETRAPKTSRQAWAHATGLFITMLEEATELHSIDAFSELFSSASTSHTFMAAVGFADGTKADEIVKLIPNLRADWKVRLAAHNVAGITVHEVTVGEQDLPVFRSVFPTESVVYIGTGKNVVWVTAGTDSLEHLKTAIAQSMQPPPEKFDPVVFQYQMQVAKLVSLIDAIQKQQSSANLPLTQDQRQWRKDIEKYVQVTNAATSGCDSTMRGELRRKGNKIEGTADLNECTLKFVGSIFASILKDLE